ncbi:hypothetical protein BD414DRAFT_477051 [Trametes punicea]|nr:hypothetical protein BD414DRAFT_477051 [Trametes punicea]
MADTLGLAPFLRWTLAIEGYTTHKTRPPRLVEIHVATAYNRMNVGRAAYAEAILLPACGSLLAGSRRRHHSGRSTLLPIQSCDGRPGYWYLQE